MVNFAIVVVSDTASTNAAADLTGPSLTSFLQSQGHTVLQTEIVPDDLTKIRWLVATACLVEEVDVVLTAGGTGFAPSDKTPEAVEPLIVKPAPGVVHSMLAHSLKVTPLAALSRPVAGLSKEGKMIVTLPGSPKGAKENAEVLLGVVGHIAELVKGGPKGGEKTHKAMGVPDRPGAAAAAGTSTAAFIAAAPVAAAATATSHSHSHDHHQGHSHSHGGAGGGGHIAPVPRTTPSDALAALSADPSLSISTRHRHSPYPLISTRQALEIILATTPVAPIVRLALYEPDLVGHVLAEDVTAEADVPATGTTNVDGYALRSTDQPGTYPVLTSSTFADFSSPLPAGSIYRINTGAPLPPGTDSVIMVEDTLVASALPAATPGGIEEEQEIRTLAAVALRENVRKAGSDVKKGELVLSRGQEISDLGGELSTLAFVGKKGVAVHIRPKVAVFSTGEELVDICSPPSGGAQAAKKSTFGGVADSNRPALIALLKSLHFEVIDLGIIGDSLAATTAALKRGKEQAQLVLSTGGTSMGVSDMLKPALLSLGGDIKFGRVAMKPGKPTTFGTIPPHPMAPSRDPTVVFALPGNPASAWVCFWVFVLPALRKMEGRLAADWELPRFKVRTAFAPGQLDSRAEYIRAVLRPSPKDGTLEATSTGGQRSSRTASLSGANALLELPGRSEAKPAVAEGEMVDCLLIGPVAAGL